MVRYIACTTVGSLNAVWKLDRPFENAFCASVTDEHEDVADDDDAKGPLGGGGELNHGAPPSSG
jgi:hypothetical protein